MVVVTFLDVCYLRLDFESFTLLGPSDTTETLGGVCARDTFKVTVRSFGHSIFIGKWVNTVKLGFTRC